MRSEPTVKNSLSQSAQALESDRELKAYIYQQLCDLQPYLFPESQIAVMAQVESDEDGENVEHLLTLVATLGEIQVEAEGRAGDAYHAFSLAKQRMIQQLEEWYTSVVDTSERDAIVQSVIEGRHMIH